MQYIVGDIGNTSTRICLINKKHKIKKSFIFDTKKIFSKNYVKNILKKFIKRKVKKEVLFSSVVPLIFKIKKKSFKGSEFKILEIKKLNLKKNKN